MASNKMKTKARGRIDKKPSKADMPASEDVSVDDLITPEDQELLKGVDENEEESVVDIAADGDDIAESEISSFLQKLGVDKYRPFPASGSSEKNHIKTKKETDSSSSTKVKQGTKPTPSDADGSHISTNESIRLKLKKLEEQQSTARFLKTYKTRKHLLLKEGEMWRDEQAHPLPSVPPDEKLVNEAETLAKRLLEDEIALYSKQTEKAKRSEARWLKTVLSTGTLSDKMAALTLLIQESPLHNMASVDTLISMAGKKGRREAMMAVDTLRDLFLTGLLPDDRKLRAFNQQPFLDLMNLTSGNVDSRDKYLVMWYYEGLLKKKYADFIKALGDMSFDTLQTTKEKAISTIHQLLTGKPEQENTLLPMLVNKLGDPSIKSKATYMLTKLVDEHPNMKPVIVREVQRLLYRPNVSQRAQYYAICFLTQLRLSQAQSELASQLIQIYFYFFQTFLKKGDIDNKMMSALLTGVNRAYVYAKANKDEIYEQMDAVYKMIPSANFHTSVQALMLLYQVLDAGTNASDRFYMCLYRKLADPALRNSSKQAIFMNLLFKSLKADAIDKRVKAFVKRILQVYSQQPPQVICGVLILLSKVLQDKKSILAVKHSAEGVWSDDEEEKFVDLPAPEEFDGPAVNGVSNHQADSDKDEGRDKETPVMESQNGKGSSNAVNNVKGSWVHRANVGGSGRSSDYDPYNRNPLYCKAELDCVWELEQLTKHYHPTVRLYASSLLQDKPIKYDGDPLNDFTLIRFLDRFVYKNPKKDLEEKKSRIHQFKKSGPSGLRAVPVNSKEFLELGEDKVPEDEKFFYQYFTERAKRKEDDASDADSDAGSIGDAEFDAFLDGFEKDADRDDFGDMDLDFAGDKDKTNSKYGKDKGKRSREEKSDDEEDDEDDDDIDLEDADLAAEFQKEMEGLDDSDIDSDDDDEFESDMTASGELNGFREEDIEMSPDEDDELKMMMLGSKSKKRKARQGVEDGLQEMMGGPSKKRKRDKHDTTNLFASAEEFAHLLEEDTETGGVSLGGTADFRNKDKAGQKQLKWEADRDRWLQEKKGGSFKHKKKNPRAGDGAGHHGKNFGKKQRHKQGPGKGSGKNFKSGQKKFKAKKKN